MNKIKKQIECYVPITSCTLRCHYCYITHQRLFDNKLPVFDKSPEFIRTALSKRRLGGVASINMCAGGETLLMPIILEYAAALAEEGHFVSIVTNGTISKRFDELLTYPKEITSHLFFKFSYHYLQLKKRGLLGMFFENINKAKRAGASFTLEITPSDELIPYIDELIQVAKDNVGAVCHCTIARDEHDHENLPILTKMTREEYAKTWSVFNSSLFSFKNKIFGEARKEFCYAGKWSFFFNLQTGQASQCYISPISQNIYDNLDKPISFPPIGNNCKESHCYNGHAFLTWGLIPQLKTPCYAEMRNRKVNNDLEWLQPEVKEFFSSKLIESNKEYNIVRKQLANLYMRLLYTQHNNYRLINKMFGLAKRILKNVV